MARQEGLEPPTFWFVAKHSIQLSYWRKLLTCGVPQEGGYAVRSQTLYPAELLAHTQFRLPYKNTTAPRYCQHFFSIPLDKIIEGNTPRTATHKKAQTSRAANTPIMDYSRALPDADQARILMPTCDINALTVLPHGRCGTQMVRGLRYHKMLHQRYG